MAVWQPTQAEPSVQLRGDTLLGLTYVVSDGMAKAVGLDDTLQMLVVSPDSEEYSHLRSVAKVYDVACSWLYVTLTLLYYRRMPN